MDDSASRRENIATALSLRSRGEPAERALVAADQPVSVSRIIFAAVAVATLWRGTGVFRFDALQYWLGAQSLFGQSGVSEQYWEIRGVLTTLIYAPAAFGARVVGEDRSAALVLFQNSVFIGYVAAVLVPNLIARFRDVTNASRVVAALTVWLASSGFAPFPLVDLYAAVAALAGAALVASSERYRIAMGGLLFGVAFNLRPSYLATVLVLGTLIAVTAKQLRGLSFLGGFGVALIPQVVVNAIQFGSLSPLPVRAGSLVSLQTQFAAYNVRYDTVLAAPNGRQFHCSPSMASRVDGGGPEGIVELATFFITELPASLGFALEKVAASLYWPIATPYSDALRGPDWIFASAITSITVLGVAVIAANGWRLRDDAGPQARQLAYTLGLMAVGGAATLATSATEARFALPVVLVGVIGTSLFGSTSTALASIDRRIAGGLILTIVATVLLARHGLSDAAPAGLVTPAICSSL